jgi:Pyruvate/2-oxoacid:ferredoxin oxidoreductase delta subunit
MSEAAFRKLADHLDTYPGGFAPSSTGADIRLLQRLFTLEEAQLGVHLTLDREDAGTIAARADLPQNEVEDLLDDMSRKGLIISVTKEGSPTLYQGAPFVVGIYEFQVNNLTDEFLQHVDDYWSTQVHRSRPKTIRQMRTIPIGESIDPQLEALPYEQVGELIKDHDRFAVAPCICRKKERLQGRGCDAPEESCLIFGEWADYYVRDGRGRYITLEELEDKLVKADAANLVLQPTNSKDIGAICCCCGCCCGILKGLQNHPVPAEASASLFTAQLEVDLCDGCWDCLDRCQMNALVEDEDQVALNQERCIGCGLCVTTCPSEALKLVRKPQADRILIPQTMDETWHLISEAQAGMD